MTLTTMLSSTNYSLFSIPAMVLLSYYPALLKGSVFRKFKTYNNVIPRSNLASTQSDSKIPPEVAARLARMEGAHYNGLESLPLLGLAVLAANYAGVEPLKLNIATGLFIVCRVIYNSIYISQTTQRTSNYRSLIWGISMVFPLYLTIVAAGRVASK